MQTIAMDMGDNPVRVQPSPEEAAREVVPSKRGEELSDGAIIEEIVQVSDRCGVYVTSGQRLHWVFREDECVDSGKSVDTAVDLLTQLNDLPISERRRRVALKIIRTALHDALQNRTAKDPRDHFVRAQEFITTMYREMLQMRYFYMALVATVSCVIVGGASLLLDDLIRNYALAGAMGAMGAFVSVMQRFRSIAIDRYSSPGYTSLAGVSRIILGVISGAIMFLMQQAGLILSLADQEPALLSIACFLSGFSERLVPELLEQFEARLSVEARSAG